MTKPGLLYSPPLQIETDLRVWFETIQKRYDFVLQTDPSSKMELRAHRCQSLGQLEDNPPLEEVDSLMDMARVMGMPIGSVLIPLDLNQTEEQIGAEISAVDGWIDLSGYINVDLVRFLLTTRADFKKGYIIAALQHIFHYANESNLTVSIASVPHSEKTILSQIQRFKPTENFPVGLHRILPSDSLDRLPTLAQDGDPVTLQYTVPDESAQAKVAALYQAIQPLGLPLIITE
ncbi:MAG: hypothetical protein RBU29_07440 [bacterium]|jgi:hypothetical protein|nr:hypothetical protein [bacterium]